MPDSCRYWLKFLLGSIAAVILLLATTSLPPPAPLAVSDPRLTQDGDRWLLSGKPFTGRLTDSADGQRIAMELRDGQLDGLTRRWYPNGQLASERRYRDGLKNGRQQEWWEDGLAKLDESVRDEVPVGVFRSWYRSGRPFEEHRYDDAGHEAGPQQVWYEDGSLRSNYVVLDGRRYGSIGPKGCVGMSAEVAQPSARIAAR